VKKTEALQLILIAVLLAAVLALLIAILAFRPTPPPACGIPGSGVNRVLRVMLHNRWSAEAWSVVRASSEGRSRCGARSGGRGGHWRPRPFCQTTDGWDFWGSQSDRETWDDAETRRSGGGSV
jgi:hypothetical protein